MASSFLALLFFLAASPATTLLVNGLKFDIEGVKVADGSRVKRGVLPGTGSVAGDLEYYTNITLGGRNFRVLMYLALNVSVI